MARIHDHIDGRMQAFIEAQQIFFVASAPAGAEGHVNLSPKGLDTLRVVSPTELAYLDYVGSGAETIAHLRENGRITVMLCAFSGAPRIVRLYGRGEAVEPSDPDFPRLRELFADSPRARCIIRVQIERVSDSCGYGVPLYRYEGPRAQLDDWAERKGEAGLRDYQIAHNTRSIDGLPALRWPEPR